MVGNEELEVWLVNRLSPRIDVEVFDFDYQPDVHIVLFRIPAASVRPVLFLNTGYVRINSSTRKLMDYPEKEAKIWNKASFNTNPFEKRIAMSDVKEAEIPVLLSTQTYFEQMDMPYPMNNDRLIETFEREGFISRSGVDWNITNLGALLFALDLRKFENLDRRALRVISYDGNNRYDASMEEIFHQGYALSIKNAIRWVWGHLPSGEHIGDVLREDRPLYPQKSVRELVNNMVLHQDFSIKGIPTIEVFRDRIEFSNPGPPLISPDRFIDEYQTRNEILSEIMRRLGFSEDKGSGMDKVVAYNEKMNLPAVNIMAKENRTVVIIYAPKKWADRDRGERLQACYQHSCVKYVGGQAMTNQSLRERFGIEERNSAMVSRVIKDALQEGLIKDLDPEGTSKKYKKYVPYWA